MAFKGFLRADTEFVLSIGPFVDSTDGDTEETALSLVQADFIILKHGQASSAAKNDTGAGTHIADGMYSYKINATDMNLEGIFQIWVHKAGALIVHDTYEVVNQNVYDSLFKVAGNDYLEVSVDTVTYAEPAAGLPPATASLQAMTHHLYTEMRNLVTMTAALKRVFADDGSTELYNHTLSDDATTATKGEAV